MRLRAYILLMGLLTGVLLESAQADEPPRGDCPPPPPGPAFVPGPDAPATFDLRIQENHFRVRVPLAEFDLNRDGRTARAEIDDALRARFEKADADRDGRLDPREFANAQPAPPDGPPPFMGPPPGMPPPRSMPLRHGGCACECGERQSMRLPRHLGPGGHRGPPDPQAAFTHFDWNLDGELSFEEFAAPIRQMALRLDRNGDGVIDADEMRGPVMFFGQGFGPPPGPPPEPPRDQ
jgi:hypothetical protein